MKKVRVLLLGCQPGYAPRTISGLLIELLGDGGDSLMPIWSGLGYDIPDGQPKYLAQLRASDYDFAVIGNNMGVGVVKAKLVPPRQRHKFVIVWNERPGENEGEYAQLGYQHFCTRSELKQKLQELWQAKQAAKVTKR